MHSRPKALTAVFALVLLATGCRAGTEPPAAGSTQPTGAATTECIMNEQGDACLPLAPASQRVDLAMPTFGNPTTIDNPLFPASEIDQTILLGEVEGQRLRVEYTLLPGTKTISWNGQQIETRTVQYLAHLDRRIHEVALDWYAQADDGAVWYFGEDVFNFEDGVVADTGGTWLAGREGPAAMIMPASPQVGNTYRPENAPGIVFEEVTVKAVDQTVDGPRGPITGALVVQELHMDGLYEDKTFAPGYAEFFTGAKGGDVEALALAVPTDTIAGSEPAVLSRLTTGAADAFAASSREDWATSAAAVDGIRSAWNAYRPTGVPPLLEAQFADALEALAGAVDGRKSAAAAQAALDVRQAALDLRIRYRPVAAVDVDRMDVWANQIRLDAAASDGAGVTSDVATLEYLRDRVVHTLADADRDRVNREIGTLRAAADGEDLDAATAAAERLQAALAALPR